MKPKLFCMNSNSKKMMLHSTPKLIKSNSSNINNNNNPLLMASVPSTSSRNMSRELLEEFLNAYRNSPCLWKIKSADYLNKELKAEAYRRLEAICQKEHPDANRDFVSKKINSLRGSFRREYRRVITENNYIPQLWFYELLHFTAEQEGGDLGEMKNAKFDNANNVSYSNGGNSTAATDYASSDYCFVSGPDDEKHFFKAENYTHIHHVNGETMESNLSDDDNNTVSSMICTTLEEPGDENPHTDDVTTTIEIPSDETNAAACCYETDAEGFVAQLVEIQDDNTSVIALVDADDDVMATETIDECQSPVSSVFSVSKRRKLISNGNHHHKNGQQIHKSSRMNFSRINRVSPVAHKVTLTNCMSTETLETATTGSTNTISAQQMDVNNISIGVDGSTGTIYSTNIPTTIRQSTELQPLPPTQQQQQQQTTIAAGTSVASSSGATATIVTTNNNNANSNSNSFPINGFDEFSAYGVTVAAKLRQMEPHQRLYAENIINQTLFLGVMQQLQPPSLYDMMFNIGIRHIKREIVEDDE